MRGLAERGPGGVSERGDDELQVPAVQKVLDLLALDVGDDLVEQHDGLIVDLLLILSVNGLQLVHDRPQVVHELLLVGPRQRIQPLDGLGLEDDRSLRQALQQEVIIVGVKCCHL